MSQLRRRNKDFYAEICEQITDTLELIEQSQNNPLKLKRLLVELENYRTIKRLLEESK